MEEDIQIKGQNVYVITMNTLYRIFSSVQDAIFRAYNVMVLKQVIVYHVQIHL